MYEHDSDECANEEQFTEETLQDGLRQLITDGYDSSEICWEMCIRDRGMGGYFKRPP